MQEAPIRIDDRYVHRLRGRCGLLPKPIGRQLEIRQLRKASGAHGSRHENRRELTGECDGHDHRLTGLQREQLGRGRAQGRLSAREQTIPVDNDDRLERPGVGDVLLQ